MSTNNLITQAKINEFIEASRALIDSRTAELMQQILKLKEDNDKLISKCN